MLSCARARRGGIAVVSKAIVFLTWQDRRFSGTANNVVAWAGSPWCGCCCCNKSSFNFQVNVSVYFERTAHSGTRFHDNILPAVLPTGGISGDDSNQPGRRDIAVRIYTFTNCLSTNCLYKSSTTTVVVYSLVFCIKYIINHKTYLVLTHGIASGFRGASIYLYRHPPLGQSRVYQVTQLRADGVNCRESAGIGLVVLILPQY